MTKATKKQMELDEVIAPEKAEESGETIEVEVEETGTELVESVGTGISTLEMSDEDFLAAEEAENVDDFVGIDRLTLDQKGKSDGAEVGEFYCKNLTQSYTGFPAVLIRTAKSRIMWPEKFSKDNEPLCKSSNGVTPVTDDDSFKPMAKNCKVCAYGKWKRTKARNIPPACGEVKDMILLNLDDFTPYVYSVHSTAMGATNQQLIKILRGKIRALTLKRKRMGLPAAHTCMFSFDISTTLKVNDAGDAYVPAYSNIQELELNQIEAMVHAAKSVKDLEIHFSGRDEEDFDEGEGESGGGDDPLDATGDFK